MPKIPILNGGPQEAAQPQVRSNIRTPNIRSNSAQINQAAIGLINSASRLEAQQIKEANRVKRYEMETELKEFQNELLHNSDTGLLKTKGKNAFEIDKQYQEAWKEKAVKMKQGLANDDQLMMFNQMESQMRNSSYNSIHSHISREADEFDKQTTSNYLKTYRDDAIMNFNNPDVIATSIERQKDAVAAMGQKYGLPGEVTKRSMQEVESKTHLGVVTRFLDSGGDTAGKEYFDMIKEKMTADDLSRASKLVEDATLRGEAQRTVDANFGQTDDYATLLERARSIKDDKLRDEVVRRTKNRIADDKAIKNAQRSENFEKAYWILNDTKNVDKIPSSLMTSLDPADHTKIMNLAKKIERGVEFSTDWPTYYNLEQMAGDPQTRQKFKSVNLLNYRDKLDDTAFKKFSKMQNDMKSGKGTSDTQKLLDGIETKSSIVNGYLRSAGIETGAKASKDNQEKAAKFKRELDNRIVEKQQALGRKVTNEEIRSLSDGLMVEAVKDSAWFGDNSKRAFEVEASDLSLDDVPQDRATDLIFKYQQRFGKNPTEQEIVEMHLYLLKKGK